MTKMIELNKDGSYEISIGHLDHICEQHKYELDDDLFPLILDVIQKTYEDVKNAKV